MYYSQLMVKVRWVIWESSHFPVKLSLSHLCWFYWCLHHVSTKLNFIRHFVNNSFCSWCVSSFTWFSYVNITKCLNTLSFLLHMPHFPFCVCVAGVWLIVWVCKTYIYTFRQLSDPFIQNAFQDWYVSDMIIIFSHFLIFSDSTFTKCRLSLYFGDWFDMRFICWDNCLNNNLMIFFSIALNEQGSNRVWGLARLVSNIM